jgi:hypothetical protein
VDFTPRESTVPNEQELEQKAARYAELNPDGASAKPHQLGGPRNARLLDVGSKRSCRAKAGPTGGSFTWQTTSDGILGWRESF